MTIQQSDCAPSEDSDQPGHPNQQSDCAPSEESDQTGRMPRLIWVFAGRTVTGGCPGWSESSLGAQSLCFSESSLGAKSLCWKKWLCAQRRLWSDWADADAQANLSLRWAHSHFVGFVMSRDWADAQADLSLRWAHSHFVGFVMSRLNYRVLIETSDKKVQVWPHWTGGTHVPMKIHSRSISSCHDSTQVQFLV